MQLICNKQSTVKLCHNCWFADLQNFKNSRHLQVGRNKGSLTTEHNNINSQLDATKIIILIISISSTCFG